MSELKDLIKESIEHHEEHNAFMPAVFYFSSLDYSEFYLNESLNRVRQILKDLGYDHNHCDTVPHAFNLNQDFEEVYCTKAIREYSFTLPYSENVELLAELCEIVWSGKVQCIVYYNE